MASTDRNQKLKNYHARKVRERQLQQQQQQKQRENVENTVVNYTQRQQVGGVGIGITMVGAGGTITTGVGGGGKRVENGPKSSNNSGNERHFKSTTTSAKSRSSRSLFATSNSTSNSSSGGGKMTMMGQQENKSRPSIGDEGRISMGGAIPSSLSNGSVVVDGMTSVVGYGGGKKMTMGGGGGEGAKLSNGGISTRVSMVPSLRLSSSSGGPLPPTTTTVPRSAAPTTTVRSTTTAAALNKLPPSAATATSVTPNKLNNNSDNDKSNDPPPTTPSTTQGDSSNVGSTEIPTITTTNNASAAARMFAARRRRAQLEMSSGGGGGDSSVGSATAGGDGLNAASSGGGGVGTISATALVDGGAKSAAESSKGITKSATASLNVGATKATTASLNGATKSTTATSSSTRETSYKSNLVGRGRDSVDSIPTRGSVESVKSKYSGGSASSKIGGGEGGGGRRTSLATRTAYERYIGNSGGGGSVSSFDGGSSSRNRGSSSSSSTSGRGSIIRPSSAPVTTISSNSGNSIGGGSTRGGINTMNSMDSADNSTIASVPSVDYGDRISQTTLVSNDASSIVGSTVEVGDAGRRAGVESLTTIREVSGSSFSSMSTIQVSNCQEKTEVIESDNGKDDNSSDGTALVAAAAEDECSDKSAPTPILRQPHRHEIKAATNDEHDGHSKSVRFALSPLERQKKVDAGVASKNLVGRVAQDDVVTSNSSLSVSNALTPPLLSVSNALAPPPSADAIRTGGDQVPSSIQKLSTPSTENDSNVDQSTPTIVQNVEAGADEDEEATDEEFTMFMNGLRREVAGDHTKLWSEFQSIMGRAPQEHLPLYQSDTDSKKKKETIQFDPQTTKTLNTIYKRFHEESQRMNSTSKRFLRKKSQLKNDKDIARQQREERRMRMAAEAEAAREEAARVEEHSRDKGMDGKSPFRRDKERGKSNSKPSQPHQSNHTNTLTSGENELAAVKLRPTPTRSITKAEPTNLSTPKDELFSVKLRPTPTTTPPPANTTISFAMLTPQKSFAIGVSNSVSKVLQRSSSKSSNGSGRSINSRDEKEKKSINWMDSLKMKQKLNRLKQTVESNNIISVQVETGGSLDTSGIVPKSVSPRKKLRISPPSSPEEKEGRVPPWAKVQLRTTQRREELLSNTPTGSVGNSTPKSFSLTPTTQSTSTKGTTADSLPPLCCVGDTIDLDSLPKKMFPDEAATVFPLKNNSANDGSQQFVVVGTIVIVTASSTAGSNGRKVDISWWCRRSTIRTLTLNVEATGATLAHANGRMPLVFESSDICLDFAQAFYRGPSKSVPQVSSPPQQPPAQKEVPNESTESEGNKKEYSSDEIGDGKIKASLTEAEESLVAEYRHFDESDKPKLRLICLSPKGEEVVEVTVSDRSNAERHATDDSSGASEKEEDNVPGLTDEEKKSVSRFKKMLAVGLPPDAVHNKMTLEGVQENVVAAVLGKTETKVSKPAAPKLESSKLSEEEGKLVSQYKKMLTKGIPPGAVRNKMMLEGVEASVVTAVLGADALVMNTVTKTKEESEVADPRQALMNAIKKKGNGGDDSTKPLPPDPKSALFAAIKNKGAESSKSKLSDEEDRVASKYRRMLKMGIPLDAVRHCMTKEGVDPKIASVVSEEASPQEAVITPVTPSKPKSGSSAGPVLSEEEEKIASKYRKMLKFCIPKDTVRHDMKKEGVSQKIVEAILGKEDTINTVNNMETPAKGKNTKTKGIHWTANNLRQDLLEESIFARSTTKKRKLPLIYPEEADIKKLEELFRKNDNVHTGKVKNGDSNAGSGMAKLLDITRANNIAIQLKAFNDFTLRALAETINDLDPDSKIVGERVQFIPQLLPTPKELQAIKKYKGESDRLNTAELFFQQLLPVKRVEDKVAVVKAMSTFHEHAEEARAAFKTLEEVCGQIMNSAKLEQILLMVLNIGNLMNEGSLDGGVEAFKFESLPKLSQTKSADGKTTVLDYIVETFIEKGGRDTLILSSDFPDIQESCRLSINDLSGDVNTLRKNYQLCKTELNSMKKDQAPKPAKGTQQKNEGEANDPRKALFAAIQNRGANGNDSSTKPAPVDPRQALFAAIKNKGAESSNTSAPCSNVKYSRGVKRLESFIWKAEASLSLTERDQGAAIRACKGLAVYCGEEGGERSVTSLLQILSAFASSLKAAVEKYDKRAEMLRRRNAQNKNIPQKKDKENQVNALPKKNQLLKASSLQPHVGLTDKVKSVSTGPNTSSLAVSKSQRSPKTRQTQRSSSNDGDARSAMFAAIKSRNQEPVGVTNKVRTINTNVQQRESRISMVHKMLKEAPANVRDDFLRGVTYRKTSDPLLQKIYQKEGVEDDDTPDELKPVDPRQELFAAIRSRRQG